MVAQLFGRAFKLEMHVPVSEMRKVGGQGGSAARFARRLSRHLGLATAIVLLGSAASQGANETRTLTLHHIHTGEDITITYKRNGQFDEAALKRLNMFVRDWRQNAEVTMAPELYDMMWEVKEAVGFKGAIHIVCGYRAPGTNEMLRGRSRMSGVAKTSLHMQGKAMDFSLPGADVAQVRAAALRIQGGGVGYYPTSGIPFVHMDVGNVRHWPRMTREQLVKVFPNGRTLHVPTDGNPLPGYELAQADHERGVHGTNRTPTPRNFLASLFSAQQEEEETSDAKPTASPRTANSAAPRRGAFQVASSETKPAEAPAQVTAAPATVNVPLPQARPAILAATPAVTFQMASAESKPAPAPTPRARPLELPASVSIASAETDIFTARGYWQGLPEAAPATPEQTAAISAARRLAAAKPEIAKPAEALDTTAAVGPFARDRSPELALSYAPASEPIAPRPQAPAPRPATVISQGAASVAAIPASTQTFLPVTAEDRLNNPWVRGVVMAASVQRSMTITMFGAPDFRALRPFIQKPAMAVMMTFSRDPNPGMTTERFTGSAIAFQPTVTFGMKTADLRQ